MSLCESHNGCKPYAMEKTSSFGSSTHLMAKQTPSLLQERLKYLVESRQEWWVYAIFWHAYKDNYQHVSLSFGDCYFRGQDSSQQGINTDSGLIIASAGRSFVLGEDIVGGTFSTGSFMWLAGANALQMNGNKRAKEVHLHGIRTLVSVSTSSGVVEFGSLNVLKEDWDLVRLTKSLFKPESDVTIVETHCHLVQAFAHQDSSLLDLQSPSNSTREDTPRKTSKKRENTTTDDRVNPIYKDIERTRRGKLNQRFYELRSVVPFVTKMDKASLLADAVTYIGELKSRIETLSQKAESMHLIADDGAPMMMQNHLSTNYCIVHTESQVEVKIVGSQAVIRMQSADANHPTARLMDAMRNLEIGIHHASAANVSNMMVQDVIAQIPEGFPKDEDILRTLILKNL